MSTDAARAAARTYLREYAVDGVPASGFNNPDKTEGLVAFDEMLDVVDDIEALAVSGVRWTTNTIRVRSTANVVIASALENGDTLNGVTLATGDHVFLPYQTDPKQNGLYTVPASGAASRATFADSAAELAHIAFLIGAGTVGAGERWTLPLDEADISLGVTNLAFAPIGIEVSVAGEVADLQAEVDARLTERLVGTTPTATGSAVSAGPVYFWPSIERTNRQWVRELEVGVSVAGTIDLIVAMVEVDDTLTLVSNTRLTVAVGEALTDLNIEVPAGAIVGLTKAGATWLFTAGTIPGGLTMWYTAAVPTTSTAKTATTSNDLHWRVTLSADTVGAADAALAQTEALNEAVGTSEIVGWADPVAAGVDTAVGYTMFPLPASDEDRWVTAVEVGTAAGGSATIMVGTFTGALLDEILSETLVVLPATPEPVPVLVFVPAGALVGISGYYKYGNTSNVEGVSSYQKSSKAEAGDTLTLSAVYRFEVAFTVKTGLQADTARALAAPSGLDGLVAEPLDATLAEARDGLWGPGEVTVDGERFFIPSAPALINLYDGLRAALMEDIAAGNVLTLIGDSIAHWSAASDGAQHFFNQLTRFANLGIAADEPIMTALRSSGDYTPAFYGVTFTGTVTTGTRGPLGESAILAAGATAHITGAYDRVGVFYTQQGGAGSLEFSYDGGAAYHSVNAAGSLALDQLAIDDTGETASGDFAITAVGNPVELTGLIREGVKTAGSAPRLRTMRAAHGSYTFDSFDDAAVVASILAQGAYAGGKCTPILQPGINDSFGTDPSVIVTKATALIDGLEAGGVERIFAMPPMRPSSFWDPSYTGGRTYEGAAGALRKLYRERGVRVLPVDMVDWAGRGLFADGLHPNETAQPMLAQLMIEGFIAAT